MAIGLRRAMHVGILCGLQVLALASAAQTSPKTAAVTARLSGVSEVPPVSGNGTGTLEGVLDKDTRILTWTLTYSGLSGPVTGGHFHGPAIAGANAGVTLPIEGAHTSPARGTASLSMAQAADLSSGAWYVNLHTAANPSGEIRGQVMVAP